MCELCLSVPQCPTRPREPRECPKCCFTHGDVPPTVLDSKFPCTKANNVNTMDHHMQYTGQSDSAKASCEVPHQNHPSTNTSHVHDIAHQNAHLNNDDLLGDWTYGISSSGTSNLRCQQWNILDDPGLVQAFIDSIGTMEETNETYASLTTQNLSMQLPPEPICYEHGCNGRRFSSFENYRRHMREKQPDKAVTCIFCNTTFTRRSNLMQHLSRMRCRALREAWRNVSLL